MNTFLNENPFEAKFDFARLKTRDERLLTLMADQKWRTLKEIETIIGYPQASVSAGLRSFRRPEKGGHVLNRQIRGDRQRGLWEYQLLRSDGLKI